MTFAFMCFVYLGLGIAGASKKETKGPSYQIPKSAVINRRIEAPGSTWCTWKFNASGGEWILNQDAAITIKLILPPNAIDGDVTFTCYVHNIADSLPELFVWVTGEDENVTRFQEYVEIHYSDVPSDVIRQAEVKVNDQTITSNVSCDCFHTVNATSVVLYTKEFLVKERICNVSYVIANVYYKSTPEGFSIKIYLTTEHFNGTRPVDDPQYTFDEAFMVKGTPPIITRATTIYFDVSSISSTWNIPHELVKALNWETITLLTAVSLIGASLIGIAIFIGLTKYKDLGVVMFWTGGSVKIVRKRPLTDDDVLRICARVGNRGNLRELAGKLGLKSHEVNTAFTNHPGQIQEAANEVLNKWMQSQENLKKAFKDMYKALSKAELGRVANDVLGEQKEDAEKEHNEGAPLEDVTQPSEAEPERPQAENEADKSD